MNMLFTNNHQLNYDEALRRLDHWTTEPHMCPSAVRLLIEILKANRDNLYFEEAKRA